MSQLEQREQIHSSFFFLFHSDLNGLDVAPLHWWGWYSFLNLSVEMLIYSEIVSQTHPAIAQSSCHIYLTIIPYENPYKKRKINFSSHLTPYTKVSLGWILDLNLKAKKKYLKTSRRKHIHDLGVDIHFSKALLIKRNSSEN